MLRMPNRLFCLLLVLLFGWSAVFADTTTPARPPGTNAATVPVVTSGVSGDNQGLAHNADSQAELESMGAPAWSDFQSESMGETVALLPTVTPAGPLSLGMEGPPACMGVAPPGPWLEGPLRPPRQRAAV